VTAQSVSDRLTYRRKYVKKIKVKVKQALYRPGVAQRVPRLYDNGTGWW
jgi:hypothetical protein